MVLRALPDREPPGSQLRENKKQKTDFPLCPWIRVWQNPQGNLESDLTSYLVQIPPKK